MNKPRLEALALGALGTLLYLATAPSLVNSDGLGYLKLLPHNFAAGHLLYMPLLRATTAVVGDGLRAGRLVNALLGGTGLVLVYGLARRALRLLPLGRPFTDDDVRFAALAATVLLGLSYGYWVENADVEAYSAAMVAMLATLRLLAAWMAQPSPARAVAVGLLLGLAVLCHLTHVMLAIPCAVIMLSDGRAPKWQALVTLAVGGVVGAGAYAYAAFVVRGHDIAGALGWIATAAHGFRDGAGIWRLGDAVTGLSKSLVYSPYLYEGDGPRMMTLFLCGFIPLLLATRAILRARGAFTVELRRAALAWIIPYGVVGTLFFGSDVERWVFVTPALAIAVGGALALMPRRRVVLGVVAVYLATLNWIAAIGPAHFDHRISARAATAATTLKAGDLVVFPGHSWDEYVALYARVEPFPLSYYIARDGQQAALARLDRDAARVVAAGGRVVALRLFTPDNGDVDMRGFDELRLLGLSRTDLEAGLRAHFDAVADGGVTRLVTRGNKPP